MARVSKKKEITKETVKEAVKETKAVKTLTRAEKKTATQTLIKDVLSQNSRKHNDLIDEVSKTYAEKFGGEDTENINDVKGRVGSVLDIMKKDGEVLYEGGMYALKNEKEPLTAPVEETVKEEKPVKKTTRVKAKKVAEAKEEIKAEVEKEGKAETPAETAVEEKTIAKKTAKKQTKKTQKGLKIKENPTEEPSTEAKPTEELPLPPSPLQPIAPVAPITPDVAPEPIPEKKEPAKKPTRSKAKKAAEIITEKETPSVTEKIQNEPPMVALNEEKTEDEGEEKTPEKAVEIKNPPVVKEKAEIIKKDVVDMSFLFGNVKPKAEKTIEEKKEEKPIVETPKAEKQEENKKEKQERKQEPKPVAEKAPMPEKMPEKTPEKKEEKAEIKKENLTAKKPVTRENVKNVRKVAERPLTADERLKEAFLKRMRALGGDYFEYYSVYLLERYSMKNGRRLEGMRISGGERDGGIDGEIELTDKFGFKETIYIQSKNWDPEKGKEEYWVVGETLLQQFIGACACRQAKDGKQHCRGIFITTSRFTPEAKRILDTMSDKIVGYDGTDLYEAAKECKFGLLYENGNWKLDEKLLSGTKAFFNML